MAPTSRLSPASCSCTATPSATASTGRKSLWDTASRNGSATSNSRCATSTSSAASTTPTNSPPQRRGEDRRQPQPTRLIRELGEPAAGRRGSLVRDEPRRLRGQRDLPVPQRAGRRPERPVHDAAFGVVEQQRIVDHT